MLARMASDDLTATDELIFFVRLIGWGTRLKVKS